MELNECLYLRHYLAECRQTQEEYSCSLPFLNQSNYSFNSYTRLPVRSQQHEKQTMPRAN